MIISFYSYKGGVGRTQLAVNLASYLCFHKGLKILLIDWDLEAPGLHYYFKKDEIKHKGIIDLFLEFETKFQNITNIKENELPKLEDSYIVKNISKQLSGSGSIDLITAGYYDETYKEYNRKVNTFNWQNFYEKLDGVTFIEYIKKELKNLNYDFIFIDSRTGVSDYSGIVNVQMPDVNILVIAPTKQNFAGSFRIAENIKNSAYIQKGHRQPIIMPILSRIDLSIEQKSNNWLSDFKKTFGTSIRDFCKFAMLRENEYISDTLLDYKRDISFGEQILFNNSATNINDKTLAKQYQLISNYLLKLNPNLSKNIDLNDKLIDTHTTIETKRTNYIFVFGSTGVGKSTIMAAISVFIKEQSDVLFRINLQNKEGNKILMSEWIRKINQKQFPSPTMAGEIQHIDIGIEQINDKERYGFTFLEMSGEDLSLIDLGQGTKMLQEQFNEMIAFSNTYLLITDVNHAKSDDNLIWLFLNYVVTLNPLLKAVSLIVSKWDLLNEKTTIEKFVKENMPYTVAWLQSSYIENAAMFKFSIGNVTNDNIIANLDLSNTKDITDWLLKSLDKK